jgi:hypothetical protein
MARYDYNYSYNYAKPSTSQILGFALAGGLAGIAATWVMDRVTSAMLDRQRPEVTEREEAARNGKSAMGIAAEETALVLGQGPLTRRQRDRWSSRLHWSSGAVTGATYGALFALQPGADWKRGLLYGTAVFLLMDEALPVAMGMKPRAFPWQSHARGAVGHLTFGLATHAALRALQAPTASVVGSLGTNGSSYRPWSRPVDDLRGALRI